MLDKNRCILKNSRYASYYSKSVKILLDKNFIYVFQRIIRVSYQENKTKTAKKTPITPHIFLAACFAKHQPAGSPDQQKSASPSSHSPPILWSPYYHPLLSFSSYINHGIHTGRPPSRYLPTSKGNACPRSDTLRYT